MGDHDYADDYKAKTGLAEKPNLENSMFQEITIPMSLHDFAKRERFKVAFGLLNETIERMGAIILPEDPKSPNKNWQQQFSTSTITAVQNELQAYLKTMRSIMKAVKEDDE